MNLKIGDRVQASRPGRARTVTRTVRALDGDVFVSDKGERLPISGITFNYTAAREGR